MILYFSGTGNSRFAAEVIENRIHDTCINAFDYIKTAEKAIFIPPLHMFLSALHIRGDYLGCLKNS